MSEVASIAYLSSAAAQRRGPLRARLAEIDLARAEAEILHVTDGGLIVPRHHAEAHRLRSLRSARGRHCGDASGGHLHKCPAIERVHESLLFVELITNHPCRNGLRSFSRPMVVFGPWPGITMASSGSVSSFVWIERRIWR